MPGESGRDGSGNPPRAGAPTARLTAPDQSDDPSALPYRREDPPPLELITRAEKLSRHNSFRGGLGVGVIAGVVVTVAVALLIIQNAQSTPLHWASFSFTAPLWIFLVLTLAAGLLLGPLAVRLLRRGRRRARERRAALRSAREALTPP